MNARDIGPVILEALNQQSAAIAYYLSSELARAFPDRVLWETEDCTFTLEQFAHEGLCTLESSLLIHQELDHAYNGREKTCYETPENILNEVEWEGVRFFVVTITIPGEYGPKRRRYILAEDKDLPERFFLAVCKWSSTVRGEVLVFSGFWYKDARLFHDIQNATLDNLVLENELKDRLLADIAGFFASEEVYRRYKIPWKRGVLLLGPPGNGKTHCIKALINRMSRPCLYVKSFKQRHDTDHSSIRAVFEHARETAPCTLVLEDLDSLLDDGNRSFFLNEMDGFAANDGILTIATTNHPERLDPAILERPSRFDRKYEFSLPGPDGRQEYLSMFSAGLEPDLQLQGEDLESVAAASDGFSYAYLKELYLSAMMRWIEHPGKHRISDLMLDQAAALLEQMRTSASVTVSSPTGFPFEAMAAQFGMFGPGMSWEAGDQRFSSGSDGD